MIQDSTDRHLTIEELAERESVAVRTVYGWNQTGTGPRYLRIGHLCRYRLADVIAWEKTRIVERSGVA
jgi:predicted DNA-binding transcriptional regulator AlpA